MANLSYWAKHNLWKARSIIVLLHIIALAAAFEAGLWLYAQQLSGLMWLAPLPLTLSGWARHRYLRSKQAGKDGRLADPYPTLRRQTVFLLTACSCFFYLLAGNQTGQWAEKTELEQRLLIPVAQGQTTFLMTEAPKEVQVRTAFKWLKDKKKAHFKKRLQALRRRWAGGEEMDTAVKVLLSLLAILLFAAAAFLIAILSCNLSCSGQEGAAIAVLIIGGGLAIWGLVAGLMAIWNHVDQGPPAPEGPPIPKRPPSKRI